MTSAPTTPLRQRMIEDMTIRQFGSKTQHDYVRVVADFARFLGRSPDRAEPEDLRRYQLHLAAGGASPAKMNAAVSALRFVFKVTLARPGGDLPPRPILRRRRPSATALAPLRPSPPQATKSADLRPRAQPSPLRDRPDRLALTITATAPAPNRAAQAPGPGAIPIAAPSIPSVLPADRGFLP